MTQSKKAEVPVTRPTLVGRTIAGKYAVESLLGSGAMGEVYRARQVALDKKIALKVMHAAVALDPSFADRFEREAKAASRLDHPNSIRVMDFGKEPDGLTYIAMEYVEGRNLHALIQAEWPIAASRIASLLIQATSALTVAHEMGVVHRDLKPENIMIIAGSDEDGQSTEVLKVLDFGIAKIMNRSGGSEGGHGKTTAGILIGTPEYMSPEQCRGEPIDARTDIYSMGVILFELLTGIVPFTGDTAIGIVVKHITVEAPRPSQINPAVDPRLEDICVKAMSKSRDERYQSARELRAALRSVLDAPPMSIVGAAHPIPPEVGSRPQVVALHAAQTLSIDVTDDLEPFRATATALGTATTPVTATAPVVARGSGGTRWLKLGLVAAVVFGITRFAITWVRGEVSRLPVTTAAVAGDPAVPAALPSTLSSTPLPAPPPASAAAPPAAAADTTAPSAREIPARPDPAAIAPAVTAVAPANVDPPVQWSQGRASVRVMQVAGSTEAALKTALPVGRYQDCYQRELKRTKKHLEGHADLKLAFVPSGAITSAQGVASQELSKVGQCCAEATLHAPRGVQGVDAKGGTAEVTIEYTIE